MLNLVGAYLGPNIVVDRPDYMDRLQKELGLNMVIMETTIRVSAETAAMHPTEPGSGIEADDSVTLRAIEEVRTRGMAVWLLFGGWHGTMTEDRLDLEAKTLDGRSFLMTSKPRYAPEQPTVVCPSHEGFEEWSVGMLADAAANYDVDVIDLTHARYVSPAVVHSLFGCGCARCTRRAETMGYDFDGMKAGVLRFLDAVRTVDAGFIRSLLGLNLSPVELISAFPGSEELPRWFTFRAKVIAENLHRRQRAVHEASGGRIRFGTDCHIPSFALLAGHDYKEIVEVTDFTQPLLTWVEWHMLTVPAAWASWMCDHVEGLSEQDALRFAYRLVGYDGFGLPMTFDELGVMAPGCEERCTALYDIVETELIKSRLYNRKTPSYAVLKGSGWPKETIQRLVARAEELGHDGVIYNAGTTALIGE